jgi:hypothetical protein
MATLLTSARDRTVRALSAAGERVGVAITPSHFYGAVANRTELRKRKDWRRPFLPSGVHWDLGEQREWLANVMGDDVSMTTADRTALDALGRVGSGFGHVEAEVLFGFMRRHQPSRVVEIGSGYTTAIMRAAAAKNEAETSKSCSITAYDPYSRLPAEVRAEVNVQDIPLQEVAENVVELLGPGDLLFIDSSHAVKTGSELHPLYLELLPLVPAGVWIHIHDIYLPFAHHPALLAEDLWDWQETALLVALMSGSQKFSIACSLSGLAHQMPEAISAVLSSYRPRRTDSGGLFIDSDGHFPASTWLLSH